MPHTKKGKEIAAVKAEYKVKRDALARLGAASVAVAR